MSEVAQRCSFSIGDVVDGKFQVKKNTWRRFIRQGLCGSKLLWRIISAKVIEIMGSSLRNQGIFGRAV